MTEHKDSSAMAEEQSPVVRQDPQPSSVAADDTAYQAPAQPPATQHSSNKTGTALSLLALLISLAAGGGVWYLWQQQHNSPQNDSQQALRQQLSTVQQTLEKQQQQQQQFASTLTQQDSALKQTRETLQQDKQQLPQLTQRLDQIEKKLATLSGRDNQTWLLAQADFLVKMAGRKLWNEQDVTTAGALLKSADVSLAEMNDPGVLKIRKALTEDIGQLSAIAPVDYDGITLKLNQLMNQVDALPLAEDHIAPALSDKAREEQKAVSGSWQEWRQNLRKSWQDFMHNFVTIRRRDQTAAPLLAPDQTIYLRENVRAQLLIATQAVTRYQQTVYDKALKNVAEWIPAYFNQKRPETQAFMKTLQELQQQAIALKLPEQLHSLPLLQKIAQDRVRNLLAQPAVTPQGE